MTTRYFSLLLGSYLAVMLGMTALVELLPIYASRYYDLPTLALLSGLLLHQLNIIPEKIGSYFRDSILGWLGIVIVQMAFFPGYSVRQYLIIALVLVLLIIIFVLARYRFSHLLASIAVVVGTTAATWVYYHLVLDLDVSAWRAFCGLLVVALAIGATIDGSLYRRRAACHGG